MTLQSIRYLLVSLVFVLLLGILVGALSEDKLYILDHEKVLRKLAEGKKLEFQLAPHTNGTGQALSTAERNLLNEGKMSRHFYQNKQGIIKQVRCLPLTEETKLDETRLTALLRLNPLEESSTVTLDCLQDNLLYGYNTYFDKKVEARVDSNKLKAIEHNDLVVSVIEQCGFPTEKLTIEYTWNIVTYSSNSGLRELYYKNFEKAYHKNLLSSEQLLTLQQKILDPRNGSTSKSFVIDDSSFSIDHLEKLLNENETALSELAINKVLNKLKEEDHRNSK